MNYAILAEELARDEYKNLSDQAAADALNARSIVTERNIPIRELAEWASQNGIMPALFAAEREPATPASLYGAIKTLLTILTPGLLDSWRVLDSGQPTAAASAMMEALMQAGLMTEEQAAELVGMATTTISRAEQMGLPVLQAHHIASARAGGS